MRVERTAPALQRAGHACFAWKASGVQSGDIAALPATDREVTLHGLHYVELTDGRVHRARGFFDLYDGAVQLGPAAAKGRPGRGRPPAAARLRAAARSPRYLTVIVPTMFGWTVHT